MKNRKFTRIMAVVLVLAAIIGCAPTSAHASGDDELKATIEKQVRAFADSIDKTNADDLAADVLTKHGLSGKGKKLSVGKSNALTATLLNSELMQQTLIEGCTEAIRHIQTTARTDMFAFGCCIWKGNSSKGYLYAGIEYGRGHENKDFTLFSKSNLTSLNSYDDSLEWMVGISDVNLTITRKSATASNIVYTVSCTAADRFDFSTDNGDGFRDLISGIGALLFREFDWESKVSFTLTVPNTCTHSSGAYHLFYDAENKDFSYEKSDSYAENRTTKLVCIKNNAESYYFELETPIRLNHDRPWVVEYDVKKPGSFVLSPIKSSSCYTVPCIYNHGRTNLSIYQVEYVELTESQIKEFGEEYRKGQFARNYYGVFGLNKLFSYSNNKTYTIHLENELSKGGNMVYLSVYETESGKTLVDKMPMDDFNRYESWTASTKLASEAYNWFNGKDLFVRYIGNNKYPFSADHFDLRIYENGEGGETFRYGSGKVKEPTCTAKGYTTYTCTCGYSYKADYVKALGHDYRAGICSRCGTDGVSAVISDGVLTLSAKGLEKGTHILLASYADGGRMSGAKLITWQGKTISEALLDAADYKLIFTDGENRLLRNAVELSP